jgi:hypothetical protein
VKFADEQRVGTPVGLFAALRIFISCLGPFGLTGLLSLFIALATVSFQAVKAALATRSAISVQSEISPAEIIFENGFPYRTSMTVPFFVITGPPAN